jgi:AraC-like DNA-binding protein
VESASTLLSGSTLGIADIAQAIGFQSRSSFTRAIKKHLGSSATEFRETSEKFPGVLDEDAISNVVGAGRHSRLSTDRNQRQR